MAPELTDLSVLFDLLDVELLDRDLYRGHNPSSATYSHLYGGLVAAQALRAAAHTVPAGRLPHSIHGYFLRRGTRDRSTILRVDRDRDGRSYSARQVVALQDGEVIFSMACSFHDPEDGPEVEAAAPVDVWDIDAVPPIRDEQGDPELSRMFEIKVWDRPSHPSLPPGTPRAPAQMWIRPRRIVGDDPILNSCIITYLSDVGTGFCDLDIPGVPFGGGPTLDHAVWFHRPVMVDDWLLLKLEPLIATRGRGLYTGAIYTRDQVRVASLTQELVMRVFPPGAIDEILASNKRRPAG